MPDTRCELIMLDRDTCGLPGEQCPYCSRPHYFCSQCFPEHNKIHQPKLASPNADDLIRDTRLAGEALAWLDEKTWTNEDKVCVSAAVFPVLLVRMSDDKEKLDRTFDYFVAVMKAGYEVAWKAKLAQKR